MASEETAPTREEIAEELKRILASDTFATRPKMRELLERLTNDTLNQKIDDDYQAKLARELFGQPKDWTKAHGTAVRAPMRNLRDSLDTYYLTEGSADLVEIRFPPRAGYAARCSYEQGSNPKEAVTRLEIEFSHAFPDEVACDEIREELEKCIRQNPSYAPAYSVLAEVSLTIALCEPEWDEGSARLVLLAEETVKAGMRLHGATWRLHVMAGALHCCRFAWKKADAAFTQALRLAPEDTRANLWYAAFLMAIGRVEEARQSVQLRLKKPRRRLTPYIEPLFLYVQRQFESALSLLVDRSLDKELVSMQRTTAFEFTVHLREWPAEALAACLCLAMNEPKAAEAYAQAVLTHTDANSMEGLWILTGVEPPAVKDPQKFWFEWVENHKDMYETPVSSALGYIRTGGIAEAIAQLERACNMGHPLMIWLHLWPIFDPLRNDERFKALTKRMNLPKGALPRRGG